MDAYIWETQQQYSGWKSGIFCETWIKTDAILLLLNDYLILGKSFSFLTIPNL